MDKVGHGAGQSGVRIVPVEHLSKLREVRNIVFSWMRPDSNWPSLPVSFSCRMKGKMWKCPYTLMMAERFLHVDICPQMTEGIQSVGPTENRWDGHRILDILCWLCKWMNTQKLDPRYGMWERS